MINSKSNWFILKELDRLVHGHKEAKVALINMINRSKLRHKQKYILEFPDEELVSTTNLMLIGDSGTGKTYLVQSLAKLCEFPLLIIDANQLAPTSASGITPQKLAKMVVDNASSLVKAYPDKYFSIEGTAAQTVVFIDEIDKLAKPFDSSGSWNRHTQAAFLTIIEDLYEDSDLNGVSFIMAGAFADMEKRADSKKNKSIGFYKDAKDDVDPTFDIEQEIVKYGLLPELVGRIQNVLVLDKLEKEDFRTILDEIIIPKALLDLRYFDVVDWDIPESKKEEIVERAVNSSMGVRVLQKEVLKMTQELEFDCEWNKQESGLSDYENYEELEKMYNSFLLPYDDNEEGD